MGNVNFVERDPPAFKRVGVQRTRYCTACLKSEDPETGGLRLCARCKVTLYCDRDCQRQHYRSHKTDCKLIDSIVTSCDPNYYLPHARKLFVVCYRSCDDFRNVHWEPCIDAYNFALSKGKRAYQIHDEIALAWLGLEKRAKALEELVKNVEFGPDPEPGIKIRNLTVLDETKDVPKAWPGVVEWTETDLLILLAIKLAVVAQLRAGPDSYCPDLEAAMSELKDASLADILKEQERQAKHIVEEIGCWWGGGIAYALRDARPFTRNDAPKLVFTEPEHFLLIQDIFFKTPGMKDLLYEFIA